MLIQFGTAVGDFFRETFVDKFDFWLVFGLVAQLFFAGRGAELNEHQPISVASGTRFLRRTSHQTPARSRIPTHSRSHSP